MLCWWWLVGVCHWPFTANIILQRVFKNQVTPTRSRLFMRAAASWPLLLASVAATPYSYAVIEDCDHCAPYSTVEKWLKTRGHADSFANVYIEKVANMRRRTVDLVLYGPRQLWPPRALIWGTEVERIDLTSRGPSQGQSLGPEKYDSLEALDGLLQSKGFAIDPEKQRDRRCYDEANNCRDFYRLGKCHTERGKHCARTCGLCDRKDGELADCTSNAHAHARVCHGF